MHPWGGGWSGPARNTPHPVARRPVPTWAGAAAKRRHRLVTRSKRYTVSRKLRMPTTYIVLGGAAAAVWPARPRGTSPPTMERSKQVHVSVGRCSAHRSPEPPRSCEHVANDIRRQHTGPMVLYNRTACRGTQCHPRCKLSWGSKNHDDNSGAGCQRQCVPCSRQ